MSISKRESQIHPLVLFNMLKRQIAHNSVDFADSLYLTNFIDSENQVDSFIEEISRHEKLLIALKSRELHRFFPKHRSYQDLSDTKPGESIALTRSTTDGDCLKIRVSPAKSGITIIGDVDGHGIEQIKLVLNYSYLSEPNSVPLKIQFECGLDEKLSPRISGGSLGCGVLLAVISFIQKRPFNFGCTGELDSSGNFLSAKDLFYKLIGAYRCNVRNLIIPACNKSEIEKMLELYNNFFTIAFVDNANELLKLGYLT